MLRPFVNALSQVTCDAQSVCIQQGDQEAAGPWCYHIPLFANPFLSSAAGVLLELEQREVDVPPYLAPIMFALSRAGGTTLGHLAHACELLAPPTTHPPLSSLARRLQDRLSRDDYYGRTQAYYLLERGVTFQSDLRLLVDVVSVRQPAWWEAAQRAALAVRSGAPPPSGPLEGEAAAAQHLSAQLAVRAPQADGTHMTLPLSTLSVKQCTHMLLPRNECKQAAWERFWRLATQGGDHPLAQDVYTGPLTSLFRSLWRIKWDNSYKAVFWRLVYDGFPTGSRFGGRFTCTCGSVDPHDRLHVFWSCPVALAVRREIQLCVPAALTSDNPAQLWTMSPPPREVLPQVWHIVCLAALNAMDHGRRVLYAVFKDTPLPAADPSTLIASRSAVLRFWELLSDYASLGLMHSRHRRRLSPTSPFLGVEVDGRLRVIRPPGALFLPPEDEDTGM